MITVPTVLILGAGASIPFGLPSGLRLLNKVCAFLNIQEPGEVSGLFNSLGLSIPTGKRFRKALMHAGQLSVDAFLEHQPDYIKIGKVAIAYVLARLERFDLMFVERKKEEHWYDYLFANLSTRIYDFEQNKLSVLTYNYDRSLEAYLITALTHSYNLSESDALEKLKSIPIVHLHGDLGEIDPRLPQSRNFGEALTVDGLKLCCERIKIIHESIEDDKEFKRAWKLLNDAERIYFVGFGYHQTNVERLRVEEWVTGREVVGSAHDLLAKQRESIQALFHGHITLAPHDESETLTFMKAHATLN
jgi:hypothetical protein